MAVEDLINSAIDNANYFAGQADSAVGAIGRASNSATDVSVAESELDATYTEVEADTTPYPVYEAPATGEPTAPTLLTLPDIVTPDFPEQPTITTAGLFEHVLPSTVIPDWNEANPDLQVDALYNELVALAKPVLTDYDLPDITPLTIGTVPDLQLPDYEAYATPEAIPAATDYATYMQSKYDAALPEMKAFVDDVVSIWISQYAPEYEEQRAKINEKLMAGMDGTVLPDQIEAAMYNRAQGRVEQEYQQAEEGVLTSFANRGFLIPTGAVVSAMNKARLAGAAALAGNATDIYIERRKSEVQHLQYVLQVAASQMQNVRALAMQYAQTGLGMIQQANAQADAITSKLMALFEHERSRHEFSLSVMQALNAQYEVKLKAALAGLEGYKLELQVLGQRTDVEAKQVEAVRLKVQTEQQKVDRYTAMVDAIVKRAGIEELKVKDFSIRADVFKSNIQARLAAFDAYKAAIDGDKAKLEGRMTELEIYKESLKAIELNLNAQSTTIDAKVKSNTGHLAVFNGELDAYRTAAQVALQKFTAEAELKKMGMDLYKTNLQASLERYNTEIEKNKAWVQAKVEAFRASTENWTSYYRLQVQKAVAVGEGYSNMAAAALQSLNSSVSQSLSE